MNGNARIIFDGEYFNIKDTLECGQLFRFYPFLNGYKVLAEDKCAFCYNDGCTAVIECTKEDKSFFENYFDLNRDYSLIYQSALKQKVDILTVSANIGKGVRILNQNKIETLFSFIVSQNNNIPRIKGIIERLCVSLGDKNSFMDEEYYTFPSAEKMASQPTSFYKEIGLGYRAEYVKRLAEEITNGLDVNAFTKLDTPSLKKQLISIYGVGPKVADCVALFGYHRSDSFPVDTWIEKVYREDFKGTIKQRDKVAEWFVSRFKENAGFFQQYLFYYKRSKEKTAQNEQKDN